MSAKTKKIRQAQNLSRALLFSLIAAGALPTVCSAAERGSMTQNDAVNGVITITEATVITANVRTEGEGSYGLAMTAEGTAEDRAKLTVYNTSGQPLTIISAMGMNEPLQANSGIEITRYNELTINGAIDVTVSGKESQTLRGIRNGQGDGGIIINGGVSVTVTGTGTEAERFNGSIVGVDVREATGTTVFKGNAQVQVSGTCLNSNAKVYAVQAANGATVSFGGASTQLSASGDNTFVQAVNLLRDRDYGRESPTFTSSSRQVQLTASGAEGAAALFGDGTAVFDGTETSVTLSAVIPDGVGAQGAIGVMSGLKVSDSVKEFTVSVEGAGADSGELSLSKPRGAAGLYASQSAVMQIDAQKLNITVLSGQDTKHSTFDSVQAEALGDAYSAVYGIRADASGQVVAGEDTQTVIRVSDPFKKAVAVYAGPHPDSSQSDSKFAGKICLSGSNAITAEGGAGSCALMAADGGRIIIGNYYTSSSVAGAVLASGTGAGSWLDGSGSVISEQESQPSEITLYGAAVSASVNAGGDSVISARKGGNIAFYSGTGSVTGSGTISGAGTVFAVSAQGASEGFDSQILFQSPKTEIELSLQCQGEGASGSAVDAGEDGLINFQGSGAAADVASLVRGGEARGLSARDGGQISFDTSNGSVGVTATGDVGATGIDITTGGAVSFTGGAVTVASTLTSANATGGAIGIRVSGEEGSAGAPSELITSYTDAVTVTVAGQGHDDVGTAAIKASGNALARIGASKTLTLTVTSPASAASDGVHENAFGILSTGSASVSLWTYVQTQVSVTRKGPSGRAVAIAAENGDISFTTASGSAGSIDVSASGGSESVALQTSGGTITLAAAGSISLKAGRAIVASGNGSVLVNSPESGHYNSSTVIEGDIVAQAGASGAASTGAVQVWLKGGDSCLKGAVQSGMDENSAAPRVFLDLADGAVWTPSGDSTLYALTGRGGVVELSGAAKTIAVASIDGSEVIFIADSLEHSVSASSIAGGMSVTVRGGASITQALGTSGMSLYEAGRKLAAVVTEGAGSAGDGDVTQISFAAGSAAEGALTIGDGELTGAALRASGAMGLAFGGTLKADDLTPFLSGTPAGVVTLTDEATIETKSGQIFTQGIDLTDDASVLASFSAGSLTDAAKGLLLAGGQIVINDERYSLGYSLSAAALFDEARPVGAGQGTALVFTGTMLEGGSVHVGDLTGYGDTSVIYDTVRGVAGGSLLVGASLDGSASVGGIAIADNVQKGFGLAGLDIGGAGPSGLIITNNKGVSLGASQGGELVTIGGSTPERGALKILVGLDSDTVGSLAGVTDPSGTLTLGSSLSGTASHSLTADITVENGSTLNTFGSVSLAGDLALKGGRADVKTGSLTVSGELSVADDSTGNLTGSLKADSVAIGSGAILNVGGDSAAGRLLAGSLSMQGGTLFIDPEEADSIADASRATIASKDVDGSLQVGRNAAVTLGISDESAVDGRFAEFAAASGLAWGDVRAVVCSPAGISLTGTGSLYADGTATAPVAMTAGQVKFGDKSLLMVDAPSAETTPAISGVTSVTVESGSKLYVSGAEKGKTYKILSGSGIESVWADGSVFADNRALKLTDVLAEDGTSYDVRFSLDDATSLFDGALIAPNTVNGLLENGMELDSSYSDEQLIDGLNSVAQMSALGSVNRNAFTSISLMNDAVTEHMGLFANEMTTKDRNIWLKALYTREDSDLPMQGLTGSGKNSYRGFVLGSDLLRGKTVTAGAAVSYIDGDHKSHTLTSTTKNDAESWGVSLYGRAKTKAFSLLGDVGYMHGKNKLSQDLMGESNLGKADTDTFTVGLRAERELKTGFGSAVIYGGARYMKLKSDSFTDSLGITHDTDTQDLWLFPLGVSFGTSWKTQDNWNIRPSLDLGYLWVTGDRRADATVSYASARDSFGYDVADCGSFVGKLAVQAQKDNMSWSLGWQYQKGDTVKSNRWSASLRFDF